MLKAPQLSELPPGPPSLVDGGEPARRVGIELVSDALERAAQDIPQSGISFLDGEGERFLSYPDLLDAAERICGGLTELGLVPGDEVLLQLDRAADFLPAFWACQLGGFIPVPLVQALGPAVSGRAAQALLHASRMSTRPLVLANEGALPGLVELGRQGRAELRAAALERCREHPPERRRPARAPGAVAVLLLTSGSTGVPKGVALSHRNVLASALGSAQVNGFTHREVSLNWLPLNHVGALLRMTREVCLGCRQVQIPTSWILEDPLRWLDAMDRCRATTSWAPNFAFGLIADRAADCRDRSWDLSALRSLWTSGEAISPRTMARFLDLLAPHGLAARALHTAWGMTEACFATFSHRYLLDYLEAGGGLAEAGAPIPGIALRIVDGDDRPLPMGEVGRLQIRGPVCTDGYYQPELNREAFTADGWLRTGDLGALRAGRLTVVGREKDVIIVNGLNLSNREVESAAEEVDGVEVSFTAACAVRREGDDTERLAVFFHPTLSEPAALRGILEAVRERIVRQVGVNPDYLVPVEREQIPKTEVGKIQRSVLRQCFEAGEILALRLADPEREEDPAGAVGAVPPASAAEREVAAVFRAVLGRDVDLDDNFFALGGSSLQVARAAGLLAEAWPDRAPSVVDLYRFPTARTLAAHLSREEEGLERPDPGRLRGQARREMQPARTLRKARRASERRGA